DCSGPRECGIRATCAYSRIFEPRMLSAGPSGLADWPRPFVFRAAHLDGCTVPPGATFHFDLNLFDVKRPALDPFITAFAQLALEGLGPGRGRAILASVSLLNGCADAPQVIYDGASRLLDHLSPLSVSLAPEPVPVDRVRVRFVTPTELKSDRHLAASPEFA